MLDVCEQQLPVDIAICSAAVSDYKVNNKKNSKIKKTGENISLDLSENPDILNRICKRNANRPSLVIGFAAETDELEKNAKLKLYSKGCDWILANDISDGKVFNEDINKITFISDNLIETWSEMSKDEVASKLSTNIINHFSA